MKILALEFSSPERGVAVLEDQVVKGFALDRTERGARCFEVITRALEEARFSAADIECIAVGLGPGSFGGIRTAIAIAQGWQIARVVGQMAAGRNDFVSGDQLEPLYLRRAEFVKAPPPKFSAG